MTGKRSKAFTLVELLTVVAIIALLISILVPSLNRARIYARETAVAAQLHSLSTGLELFRSEFGFYPSSEPQNVIGVPDTNGEIQGAHRMVFALCGRDLRGCPGKTLSRTPPGFPATAQTGPDSILGYYYDDNTDPSDGYETDPSNWDDAGVGRTYRKGPYVETEGFTVWNDSNTGQLYTPLLCDKFDRLQQSQRYEDRQVILYYAADRRNSRVVSLPNGDTCESWYTVADNQQITDVAADPNNPWAEDTFHDFIKETQAAVGTRYRTHNPESFLLISKGYDGVYGTEDDIVNWNK